jgi:hypothetical protein
MRVWTVHVRPPLPEAAAPAAVATPAGQVGPGTEAQGPQAGPWPATRGSVPATRPAAATPAAEPVVLVREGFSWPAFFLSLLWLLWHRLWLAALVYAVATLLIALLLPPGLALPANLALTFLLGAHAHDLRRRALARRGYAEVGVVTAADRDHALARLLAERPDLVAPVARTALA